MNQNKRIAEFMGLRFENNEYYIPAYNSGEWFTESKLAYHKSWDWLMPVVEKCFKDAHEDDFFEISGSLPDMDATHKAVVAYIEGLSVESVEPDTKAIDEAFFAGFCHALEYVKTEMLNADDIEHEVDESVGDLSLRGTITIQLDQYLDADGLVDEVMRKYERDTPKDGGNV